MDKLKALIGRADRWQRRHRPPAIAYGVIKKFSNDNANLQVVSLGWYGFTAIFPLLLVVVTILGFVGAKSLGTGIVDTLHKFPVVGSDFNPASSSRLHGSVIGLTIGLLGLLYGAQGVTNTAQGAMAAVWNVPQYKRTGFVPRLGRSLFALVVIGLTFVIDAAASTYATGGSETFAIRVPIIVAILALNAGSYYLTFITLTPKVVPHRRLLPGAVVGGVGFTLLITIGTGLLSHELKNTSNTYGTFGSVIGVVAFLLLLAKLSIYAAELNPVLHRHLYPRALPFGEPTEADEAVLAQLVHQQRNRDDEQIGVGFGPDATEKATDDLRSRSGAETVDLTVDDADTDNPGAGRRVGQTAGQHSGATAGRDPSPVGHGTGRAGEASQAGVDPADPDSAGSAAGVQTRSGGSDGSGVGAEDTRSDSVAAAAGVGVGAEDTGSGSAHDGRSRSVPPADAAGSDQDEAGVAGGWVLPGPDGRAP